MKYPDPHSLNADLHCHSVRSDGTLQPHELAQRAYDNGVKLWSLTDHDEVSGLAPAQEAARALGLAFVPGVEVSVTWANETIHVVGLHVPIGPSVLSEGLETVRGGRAERAQEMARQLEQVGIHGSYEGASRYVGNPDLISRTHFARYLVEIGACTDVREVFTRYLVPGKPGYVPHRWAGLKQAVGWIREVGGQAVLAHPGRYRINDMMLHTLLEEFVVAGGEGIEVVTGSHTIDQYSRFARLSVHYGLLASRGSDFHGPGESRVNLGELPPLPDGCVPIWHNW